MGPFKHQVLAPCLMELRINYSGTGFGLNRFSYKVVVLFSVYLIRGKN